MLFIIQYNYLLIFIYLFIIMYYLFILAICQGNISHFNLV